MTRQIRFVSLLAVGLAAASNAQAHEDGDYQTGGGVGHELLHGLGIPHSHGGYGHGGMGEMMATVAAVTGGPTGMGTTIAAMSTCTNTEYPQAATITSYTTMVFPRTCLLR